MKNLKNNENKFSLNDGRKNLIKKLKNLNKEKKMKSLMFFVVLLFTLFTFSGCQDMNQGITSSDLDGNKITSFTGSADGETIAPNGMTHPLRHFEGTGTSSLTNGECTIVLEYWALPNGTSVLGKGKLIAANGNELHTVNIAGTWSLSGTTVTFTCSGDIAGGTGQFTNALGTITITGTMDAVTRVTHGEWTGTLRHARPFSGDVSALNNTVTEPPCETNYIRRYAEGTGNALHFGEFNILLGHCINMSTGFVKSGIGTIENLEGESITINYIGCISPTTNPALYDVILMGKIVSGTGKFSDAEGSVISYSVQNMATGYVEGTLNGAIDY